MKPGDLVKLVLPTTSRWPAGVVVSWQRDHGVVDAPLATRFPEGTLAVFLACAGEDAPSDDGSATPTDTASVTPTGDPDGDGVPTGEDCDDATILIEGRVGWVWSRYLEVIDEAG